MAMPDVFLMDGVEGGLFEGEGDFDEAFVVGGHGVSQDGSSDVIPKRRLPISHRRVTNKNPRPLHQKT